MLPHTVLMDFDLNLSYRSKIDFARDSFGESRSILLETIMVSQESQDRYCSICKILVDQDRHCSKQSWWVKNLKIDIARYNLGWSRI